MLDAAEGDDTASESLFPAGSEYLLLKGGKLAGGSAGVVEQLPPSALGDGIPQLTTGSEDVEFDGWRGTVTRFKAGPPDAMLLLFVAAERGSRRGSRAEANAEPEPRPKSRCSRSDSIRSSPATRHPTRTTDDRPSAPEPSLSSLFDRLAGDSELYAPLEAPPADQPNPAEAETTIRAIIDFAGRRRRTARRTSRLPTSRSRFRPSPIRRPSSASRATTSTS